MFTRKQCAFVAKPTVITFSFRRSRQLPAPCSRDCARIVCERRAASAGQTYQTRSSSPVTHGVAGIFWGYTNLLGPRVACEPLISAEVHIRPGRALYVLHDGLLVHDTPFFPRTGHTLLRRCVEMMTRGVKSLTIAVMYSPQGEFEVASTF